MPEDYLNCVENYIKHGVSPRAAKARCAAWFYKKHGITVKEAHEKLKGGTGSEEYAYISSLTDEDVNSIDEELVRLIMTDLKDLSGTTPEKDVFAKSVGLSMNTDLLEDYNVVEIVAAKVGSPAFSAEGIVAVWTKKALERAQKTWKLTRVSINHKDVDYGRVLDSYMVGDELRMLVKVNDELKEWIKTAGNLLGVSIEASKAKIGKKLEILDAVGSGVTFVFPPYHPACKIEDGCGIVAVCDVYGFVPPEAGDLPDEGKKILEEVYNKCRSEQYKEDTPENKEICAKIAWDAVKKAGFERKDGSWVKSAQPTVESLDNISEEIKSSSQGDNIKEKEVVLMAESDTINWSEIEASKKFEEMTDEEKANILENIDGAKLTYQQRKELPDSAFCGPDRSFPAHDAAHVRNGLARLPQAKGLSEAQKARIKSCLKQRAEKYGIEVSSAEPPAEKSEKPTTICIKLHEKMLGERDARIAELEKELNEMKTLLATRESQIKDYEDQKRKNLLSTLKDLGVDVSAMENETIGVLEKALLAADAARKAAERTPVMNSGASIVATEQETVETGKVVTTEKPPQSVDEILDYTWKVAEERYNIKRPKK